MLKQFYYYFKSNRQGRDFVVQNPNTGDCYAGYFSGEELSEATLTTEIDGLERQGYQAVMEQSLQLVSVIW